MSLTKNALSVIMGQIVTMETGITSTVSLRLFYMGYGHLCVACTNAYKIWAKSDKNWPFWKMTFSAWKGHWTKVKFETCWCQSGVSMMIGSKSMQTFVKNEFVLFMTLTLTNVKNIIFQVSSMLWWYKCWCH